MTEQEKKSTYIGNEFVSAESKEARASLKQRIKSRPELAPLLVGDRGYPHENTVYILYLILECLERIEKQLEGSNHERA